MEKLLTITVPCFNSAAYMERCIDSLLVGREKVEIIIVDDGSTDDTGVIADRYQERYPDIVKVVHQENGGHGEGINQGLNHASGKYFKVVDSDDWVDKNSYQNVLHFLQQNDVDLLVTNYVYEHPDGNKETIRYNNVFEPKRILCWKDSKRFRISQYLTLHSCLYRTQVVRACDMQLPKHTFYEDNQYVYTPLPNVERIAYLDVDFYRYLVGREGQSVSEDLLKKRYDHQIRVSKAMFDAYDLKKIKKENQKLSSYMYHELMLMMALATIFTRLNKTKQTEQESKELWRYAHESNPGLTRKLRYGTPIGLLTLPGNLGNHLCCRIYHLAHRVVRFN